jgi:hypothetical protein
MKAKTEKIAPTFAADTSFGVAIRVEIQLAALPDPNEPMVAPQIVTLRSQSEHKRPGLPYSALND